MTGLQKTAVALAIAATSGAGFYQAHRAKQFRNEAELLRAKQSDLIDQNIQQLENFRTRIAVLEKENEHWKLAAVEVGRLRDELSGLKRSARTNSPSGNTVASPASLAIPAEGWALDSHARIYQLQRLLDQMPGQRIPELQFLSESDWLKVAQNDLLLSKTGGIRQAFFSLKSTAKSHFGDLMAAALRSYTKANNGLLPGDLTQLQTYFPSPVESTLLQRYQIVEGGNANQFPADHDLIVEKFPDDPDFDTLLHISVRGTRMENVGSREALEKIFGSK